MSGYIITLAVALILPHVKEPIEYQTRIATITECNLLVAEMTAKAPHELAEGGELQASCVISVPPSENP